MGLCTVPASLVSRGKRAFRCPCTSPTNMSRHPLAYSILSYATGYKIHDCSNPRCKNNILWASNHLAQPHKCAPSPPNTPHLESVSSLPYKVECTHSATLGCKLQGLHAVDRRYAPPPRPTTRPLPRGLSEGARSTNPLCSLGLRLYYPPSTRARARCGGACRAPS